MGSSEPNLEAYWLMLTNQCSLRCRYCFTTDFPRNQHMKKEVIRSTVELAILHGLRDSRGRSRKLVFFGGEPLLQMDLIRWAVYYAEERKSSTGISFEYMISTNGTELQTSHIKFFKEFDFKVQISLDGPAEIHDQVRIDKYNRGSWERTVSSFYKINDAGLRYPPQVRTTLSHYSPSLLDLLSFYESMRIPVVVVKPDFNIGISGGDMFHNWCQEQLPDIEKIADRIIALRHSGITIHPFLQMARRYSQKRKNRSYCDSGFSAVSIAQDGAVYPCHRFINNMNYRLAGSPREISDEILHRFQSRSAGQNRHCRNCSIQWICGGGCPATSISSGKEWGEPTSEWCEYKQFEFQIVKNLGEKLHPFPT